jgi:hypothetical protein
MGATKSAVERARNKPHVASSRAVSVSASRRLVGVHFRSTDGMRWDAWQLSVVAAAGACPAESGEEANGLITPRPPAAKENSPPDLRRAVLV